MRRIILFVIAVALVGGGGYLLFLQLSQSTVIFGGAIIAGVMMIAIGAYIIWADFLGGEDDES